MDRGAIVDVQHLSRRFGDRLALNDVSFRADEGRVYGLVGVNGAGKTTFIKHLLGLLRAQSGSVSIFGKDPVQHPVEVLADIGYLSEKRDLPDWMSVNELMRYTEAYYPNWDRGYAAELLQTFGLDDRKKVKALSSGMRAQVGLIAAVAYRPRLLILDEPSSGLDVVVRQDILEAIVTTVRQDGRTVIFSSHLLDEVDRMSDHITMINAGQVVLDDDYENVASAHRCTLIRHDGELPEAAGGLLAIEQQADGVQVIHERGVDVARSLPGAEILSTREATLHEVFVARVGPRDAAGIA